MVVYIVTVYKETEYSQVSRGRGHHSDDIKTLNSKREDLKVTSEIR